MSNKKFEDKIVDYILKSIQGDIKSIAIIGSYTIDRILRSGSDIDTVIVVNKLSNTQVDFDNIFYKLTTIDDSQGKRIELNTKLDGIVLDITIIDEFNHPNSPLTDWYENHLGWCEKSICIYGKPLPQLFNLDAKKIGYEKIRERRLSLVEEKINMTKHKIKDQNRRDLHIMYELQNYIFIREIIKRRIFNRLSIKHPEDAIDNFDEIYQNELKGVCGITVKIIET